MRGHLIAYLGGAILGFAHSAEAAQQLDPAQAGLPPILAKIFGQNAAFTATAQVELIGETRAEALQLPMRFFYLEGNMRADINMAAVKSEALPMEMVLSLKQIGMDQVVTIVRFGKHPALILYPHLQASVEIPAPEKPSTGASKEESVRQMKMGTERAAGRDCDKYRFVYRDSQSTTQEALIWRAPDLAGFPVQIQMTHAKSMMVVRYSDINMNRPSLDKFAAPAGYRKYDSMEQVMEKALSGLLKARQE